MTHFLQLLILMALTIYEVIKGTYTIHLNSQACLRQIMQALTQPTSTKCCYSFIKARGKHGFPRKEESHLTSHLFMLFLLAPNWNPPPPPPPRPPLIITPAWEVHTSGNYDVFQSLVQYILTDINEELRLISLHY